jgi:hypothetical protein
VVRPSVKTEQIQQLDGDFAVLLQTTQFKVALVSDIKFFSGLEILHKREGTVKIEAILPLKNAKMVTHSN